MELLCEDYVMNKLNLKVGDQVIAHDTLDIINDCVGVVSDIKKTYPTKLDFENKTNHEDAYVCQFDRGTFILKENQIQIDN